MDGKRNIIIIFKLVEPDGLSGKTSSDMMSYFFSFLFLIKISHFSLK